MQRCNTCYRNETQVEMHDVNWCEHCWAKWVFKKTGRYPYGYIPEEDSKSKDLAHFKN